MSTPPILVTSSPRTDREILEISDTIAQADKKIKKLFKTPEEEEDLDHAEGIRKIQEIARVMFLQGFDYTAIRARIAHEITLFETKMIAKYHYPLQRVEDARKNASFDTRLRSMEFPQNITRTQEAAPSAEIAASMASASSLSQNALEAAATVGAGGFLGDVSKHYVSSAAASLAETRATRAVHKAVYNEAMGRKELHAARQANPADINKVRELTRRHGDLSTQVEKAKEIAREQVKAKQAIRSIKPAQVLVKGAVVGLGTAAGWVALKTAGGAVNLLLGSNEAH